MLTKKMKEALKELLHQVNTGREFPDAHTDVVYEFELSDKQAGQLIEAYDEYCIAREVSK